MQEIKGSFEEFGSTPLVKSKDSTKANAARVATATPKIPSFKVKNSNTSEATTYGVKARSFFEDKRGGNKSM